MLLKNFFPSGALSKEERILIWCLVASLLVHTGFLIKIGHTPFKRVKKTVNKMKVNYVSKPEPKKEEPLPKPKTNILHEDPAKTAVLLKRSMDVSPLVRDIAKMPGEMKIRDKQISPMDRTKVERKISVPMVQSKKINNPLYLNYYQMVRERIKDRAYLNYSKFENGEVYLTFVILSNGVLKQIKLIEEKTSANDYLRKVGLKSIREASPFPAFPKDLNYPELSFNVVISFETSKVKE